jgi:hypothetical protein
MTTPAERPNFPLLIPSDAPRKNKGRNPMVHAKLFCPWSAATWWITEYNPKDRIAFGFAYLGDEWCAELGSVCIDELESINGPLFLTIERDRYFTPKPLSEALEAHGLHEAASNFKGK